MYYINYDEDTGTIIGIYPSSYNPDDVPEPKITITDEQYNALGEDYYIVVNGALVKGIEEQGIIPTHGSSGTDATIKTLQTEYEDTLEKLKDASVAASIMETDEAMEAIHEDYRALLSDFTRKAIDIEEGASSITTGEYCAMCGTLLVDGVCPNCRWRA